MSTNYAKKLIEEFNKIKLTPKRRETFMSISGYPHYENVVSNILKFFFEDNEHNMKNLWVRSLLENVPNLRNTDFKNVVVEEVYREYATNKHNRIDIVVVCDDYIISIENKIFHYLSNDLEDYANKIAELNNSSYGRSKTEVNIVLSLNAVDLNGQMTNITNLCNVTYDMLFRKVKDNIGAYMLNANNDWLIKMQDFIYTVEGLKGGNFMDRDFAKFLYDNRNDVNRLLDAIDNYCQSIKKEVKGLKNALLADVSYKNYVSNNFTNYKLEVFDFNCNWSGQRLFASVCIDINTPDKVLTIENYIDSEGWHIVLWVRKGNKDVLKSILINNGIKVLENPFVIKDWKGCEVACVPVKEDGYQEVIEKIVSVALVAAEKVLNSSEW